MNWCAIAGFRIVTADPERLVRFYAAIGFAIGAETAIPASEMRLLGMAGGGRRRALSLGASRVALDTFDVAGAPYPDDVTAADLAFQHLALVTDDAAAAWARARAAGAMPISHGGPVTLPAASGGVTAIKFRDPEGHPLEFLQFPAGANPHWQGRGVLGIDHSAIAVADAAASRRFFAERGLENGAATLNTGPAQDALDGLADVAADVVPLLPAEAPPHLELLGYRRLHGRPRAPLAPNDIAATRIVWRAGEEGMVRDPDGHLHQLTR